MAYTEVFVDSTSSAASDLLCSGAPATLVTNSTNSGYTCTTTVGANVTINCGSGANATALKALIDAATGSGTRNLIFVDDTTANARNFAWFIGTTGVAVSVNDVVITTTNQNFSRAIGSLNWAIGGKRATIGSASSRRMLFNNSTNGDLVPGTQTAGHATRVVLCNGHAEAISADLSIALPMMPAAGTGGSPAASVAGGTSHQIVSEAYATTPVTGTRPVITMSGALTQGIIYDVNSAGSNGLAMAGFNLVRASGTGGAGIYSRSKLRVHDLRVSVSGSANLLYGVNCVSSINTHGTVSSCRFSGHTASGFYAASGAFSNANGFLLDNEFSGGTIGVDIANPHGMKAVGNRFYNCSTAAIKLDSVTASLAAVAGAIDPNVVSHNSILSCGVGVGVYSSGALSYQCEGLLNGLTIANNNIERCTTGILIDELTINQAHMFGIVVINNNTGAAPANCTTAYDATIAAVLQQGGLAIDTGMRYEDGVFIATSTDYGLNSTNIGGVSADSSGSGGRIGRNER